MKKAMAAYIKDRFFRMTVINTYEMPLIFLIRPQYYVL